MASSDLPRPTRALAAAILAGACLAGPARADIYSCTTAGGRAVSSDTPPPDCRDREVRVINPDGSVKRVIPAPLTKAQREERDEAARAQAAQQDRERERQRKDRALLETFGAVDEIEAARQRTLAMRQAVIDRAEALLGQYAKEKKSLDNEAEFYAKRQMPAALRDKFDANARLRQQQEKVKADALTEMQHINEKFDADVQRFREILEESRKAAEARQHLEHE
jgi:hypothetical protein